MMIFKNCVWPSVQKDEVGRSLKNCGDSEMVKSLFHWCPSFSRRKSVGIEINLETASINREIPRLITTPVIPLHLNQSVESIDKKEVDEENEEEENKEENLNEKNQRHASAQANPYRIQNLTDQSTQCSGRDQVPYEVSSTSSNSSVEDQGTQKNDSLIHDVIDDDDDVDDDDNDDDDDDVVDDDGDDDDDDEEIQSGNLFGEKSFNVITGETNPSRKNSIEQVTPSVLSSDSIDLEKETSSDDVQSGRGNDSDEKDEPGLPDSSSSVVSNETNSVESMRRIIDSSPHDNGIKGDSFDDHDAPEVSMTFDREYSNEDKIDIESRVRASIYPDPKTHFQPTDVHEPDNNKDTMENEKKANNAVNTVSILVASRPHSRATSDFHEAAFQTLDYHELNHDNENLTSSSIFHISRTLKDQKNTDTISTGINKSFTELPNNSDIHVVTSSKVYRTLTTPNENGTVPEVIKTHGSKITERLPRNRVKPKVNSNKVAPLVLTHHHGDKMPGRSKPLTVQCFAQLESSDWEVTIKGLKALSEIARQHPQQLDACHPGTVGILLGRHVRNLRSQVARTACLAAGDIFQSKMRCLDQDLDDIAGSLLKRTADTNKFLRTDSNAALDIMIQQIPPQKTVAVIVHRGASHQNAIVRAATARLLATIVDRIGPELILMLPRDVRDKFLSSGAKLLMDGNLDARNHAKMMFKNLSRWEGFKKALTESVPETTLRHIEKTLRSL